MRPAVLPFLLLPTVLFGSWAHAATIQMDVASASTGCNLRNALQTANTNTDVSTCRRTGPDTEPDILLMREGHYQGGSNPPYADEDANARGDYDVTSAVVIQGLGISISSLSGPPLDRVFDVHSGASLTVRDVAIFGGSVVSTANPVGGAIYKRDGGSVTLERVSIRDGSAERGGAIFANMSAGPLTLDRVTIRGAYASDRGGAIALDGSGSATLTQLINTTLSGNTATQGAAIHAALSALRLRSSTLSANRSTQSGAFAYTGSSPAPVQIGNSLIIGNSNDFGEAGDLTCAPNIQLSQRLNSVIGASAQCSFATSSGTPASSDVRLMPLFDYGSGLPVHALNHGSSAIDAGTGSGLLGCASTDARGAARSDSCDIGAFELRFDATVNSFADLVDATPGDGQCRTSNNQCTLRAATMEANASGGRWFIGIPPGTYALSPRVIADDDDRSGDIDIRPADQDTPPLAVTLFGLGDPGDTQIVGGGDDRVLESRARFGDDPQEGFERRLVSTAVANLTVRGGRLANDPFVPFSAQDSEQPMGAGVSILGGYSLLYNIVIRDNELLPDEERGLGAGLGIRVLDREHSSSRFYPSEARVERFAIVDNRGAGDAAIPTHVLGGGVFAAAPEQALTDGVTMINGTIAGNRADAISGLFGADRFNGAFLTIVGNQVPNGFAPSPSARAGVQISGSEHLLQASIITGNLDGSVPSDCATPNGSLIGTGFLLIGTTSGCTVSGDTASNLIGVDARLGAREIDASGMPLHRLAQNSPAAGAVPAALCADTNGFGVLDDATGAARPEASDAAGCEIGAIEGATPTQELFADGFE